MTPAAYGCEKCDARYPMGGETTVYIYTKQPWFNHIVTTCPGCHKTYYVFELEDATIRYMEANNHVVGDEINWSIYEFAPDDVWRRFCEETGRPFPDPPHLASRAEAHIEAEVGFFHFLLERGEAWPTL